MILGPEEGDVRRAKKHANTKPVGKMVEPLTWAEWVVLGCTLIGYAAAVCATIFGHPWSPYGGTQ